MTTLHTTKPPLVSAFLAFRQAARLRRNERSTTSARTHVGLNAFIRTVLHLAGFLFLTWAAFSLSMTAGLAMAAISCFAFSALMVPSSNDNSSQMNNSRGR